MWRSRIGCTLGVHQNGIEGKCHLFFSCPSLVKTVLILSFKGLKNYSRFSVQTAFHSGCQRYFPNHSYLHPWTYQGIYVHHSKYLENLAWLILCIDKRDRTPGSSFATGINFLYKLPPYVLYIPWLSLQFSQLIHVFKHSTDTETVVICNSYILFI